MAFPIIPRKRSGATGNPSSLTVGELAVNTATGELFLGGDEAVMLLNPPTSAGTTVTEHPGDGTTTAFTFTGYNGVADGGYLVSVGGIDQPPSKYAVSATAGGTLTFVEAPVAGELISIRAIVAGGGGGGGTGDATSLQGIPVSETDPVTGQGLVYNGTAWAPGAGTANATQIQSTPVSATAPTIGQGLVYNGTAWAPATPQANATQLQSRDVAATAPTGGQVLAWNATTSKWEPTSLNGSVGFNAPGTYTWAVPAWVRFAAVNALAGTGDQALATDGADGQFGVNGLFENGVLTAPTTGANGADGTATDGVVGKSILIKKSSTQILSIAGGIGGTGAIAGQGGGGSGGGGCYDDAGNFVVAAPGADGTGAFAGKGGGGATATDYGVGGLRGSDSAGDGQNGNFVQGGDRGLAGSNNGGDGGSGGGAYGAQNGGGGGGGDFNCGGGGGGGGFGTTVNTSYAGSPGKGGKGTNGSLGEPGQEINGPIDFSAYAGDTVEIVISEGAGNASITITW